MQEKLNNIVLCICTRNRPNYVNALLKSLTFLNAIPRVCIVVDSSDGAETESVVNNSDTQTITDLKYIQSLPGLPHQRNVAVEYIKNNSLLNNDGIVAFLDDDVRVLPNYFEKINEIFDQNPTAIHLGGVANQQISLKCNSFFRRISLLDSKKSGVILKSGFATLPIPKDSATRTVWNPGGAQSIKMSVFRNVLFDGKIRMYGEDVDFCLRIASLGDLYCSIELPVRHLAASEDKDLVRNSESYTDGFRWTLAMKKQGGVSKSAIIYSTAILMTAEFLLSVIRLETLHLNKALGHFDFFYRLIRGKEVQQKVEHAGSGPSTSQ